MNPPYQKPLSERVATLEAIVPTLESALTKFDGRQDHQESLLNTITVHIATLTERIGTISIERSRWKDPMLYVTAVSVVTAIAAVYMGKI